MESEQMGRTTRRPISPGDVPTEVKGKRLTVMNLTTSSLVSGLGVLKVRTVVFRTDKAEQDDVSGHDSDEDSLDLQ